MENVAEKLALFFLAALLSARFPAALNYQTPYPCVTKPFSPRPLSSAASFPSLSICSPPSLADLRPKNFGSGCQGWKFARSLLTQGLGSA